MLTEKKETNRWREYFEIVFNRREEMTQERTIVSSPDINTYENDEGLPGYEEFYNALKRLKNMKAPEEDTITAELIKHAGEK